MTSKVEEQQACLRKEGILRQTFALKAKLAGLLAGIKVVIFDRLFDCGTDRQLDAKVGRQRSGVDK